MHKYIEVRVKDEAEYILNTKSTIRKTAKAFGISKSTVHKDIEERLSKLEPQLYKEIRELLDYNLSVRHVRGGAATRRKYIA